MENTCPNCAKPFSPKHGNQQYCSSKCQDLHKRIKQRENNQIIAKLKTGFLSNYKLFCKLHPKPGTISIPLLDLLKTGFDQDAFYGTSLDKNKDIWYRVNEYAFCITKQGDESILNIYKS